MLLDYIGGKKDPSSIIICWCLYSQLRVDQKLRRFGMAAALFKEMKGQENVGRYPKGKVPIIISPESNAMFCSV